MGTLKLFYKIKMEVYDGERAYNSTRKRVEVTKNGEGPSQDPTKNFVKRKKKKGRPQLNFLLSPQSSKTCTDANMQKENVSSAESVSHSISNRFNNLQNYLHVLLAKL